MTNQIRVGSGGIMLMHYSPLKMAEIFKTLTTLYPNRIDFGVGRAPGGDQFSTLALHEGKQPNLFNQYDKLVETIRVTKKKLATFLKSIIIVEK